MAKDKSVLTASSKAVDPALASLFSSSAGPIKAPPKSRYVDLLPQKPREAPKQPEEDEGEDDDEEELSEASEELENVSDGEEESENESSNNEDEFDDEAEVTEAKPAEDARKRKRKQRDDDEDLEAKYFERLAEEDDEPTGKRRKDSEGKAAPVEADSGEDAEMKDADSDSDNEIPVHESLAADPAVSEIEKANRTVFLSNVSSEAVTSRTAKKALLKHLASVLDPKASPPQKVESIRFRSTAFASAALPKRAAYIKKEVKEATTKSTHAYVIYSTPLAVRLAVEKLNGTVVLDRHLRVDSVAHPSPVDHRRCVFVGNLGFVDDETVFNVKRDEDGKEITEKKKRTKQPMDIEEGLWRVFGKEAGKVESVRVPRDSATRVGKGFAYVQFYDGNDVEKAILLNEKKFPPMLPRALRVTRCKAPHKTARALEAKEARQAAERKASDKKSGKGAYVPKVTAEAQTLAGRAGKLLGRAGAAQLSGKGKKGSKSGKPVSRSEILEKSGIKPPENFVFEGRRASEKDGKPKDLKFKGARSSKDKKGYKKPGGRGATRAANWRASGGDKKKAPK
ncbi:putative nucleolar protein 12 [Cladorrhinum sp. PSN259]|nr:putative nucleolar protein 12 [Cladorrhinum sp. PSN259]